MITDKTIHWYIIIYSRSTRTYYLRIKPSLFLLLSDAWGFFGGGFWRGSSNTNLVVFGLTWHGIEPTIFIIRDEQVYHYTPCVIIWRLSDQWSEVVGDIVNGYRLYQVRVITVFTVFRLLTDFVCLYTYEFWLYLCKIVRSSVILLLPLFALYFQVLFNFIFFSQI